MGLCDSPSPPDPADAYVTGIETDLRLLPRQLAIETAAKLGQKYTYTTGGKERTVDFTGLGDAEYQKQYADKMAATMLQIQQDLGPEYVAQRLHELELSDPEGAAMRKRLFESIQGDLAEASADGHPAAEKLQGLILAELQKGGSLPDSIAQRVQQGVRGGQVARGNWLGNAAATQEATAMADATEQQATQRQQQALAFLTSGVAPQDVQFREQQQSMSNLGSFMAGETPLAQFGQLSGAQNQIVPFSGGAPGIGGNPNAGVQGISIAQQNYGTTIGAQANQVNPWMAGISGGVQGLNLWSGLGGRFGQQTPQTNNTNGLLQYQAH